MFVKNITDGEITLDYEGKYLKIEKGEVVSILDEVGKEITNSAPDIFEEINYLGDIMFENSGKSAQRVSTIEVKEETKEENKEEVKEENLEEKK